MTSPSQLCLDKNFKTAWHHDSDVIYLVLLALDIGSEALNALRWETRTWLTFLLRVLELISLPVPGGSISNIVKPSLSQYSEPEETELITSIDLLINLLL